MTGIPVFVVIQINEVGAGVSDELKKWLDLSSALWFLVLPLGVKFDLNDKSCASNMRNK